MELYQLAYFVEVARQQNFTRAAERLNLAQPALSQQIHRLEEELGAKLFERGPRKTLLSTVGEAFYPRAKALLQLAEAAKQTVAEVARLRQGRLVIAIIPTLSVSWLPRLIHRFRRLHPEVELILQEQTSDGVAQLVRQGIAEFGFLQLPVSADHFAIKTLFTEPFYAVLRRDHPLAEQKSVRLFQLAKEPFICFKGKVRALTLDACRVVGFEPVIACESTSPETIRALVTARLGVAVLPRMAVQKLPKQLTALVIRQPALVCTHGMVTLHEHVWSAAAKAFLQITGLEYPAQDKSELNGARS